MQRSVCIFPFDKIATCLVTSETLMSFLGLAWRPLRGQNIELSPMSVRRSRALPTSPLSNYLRPQPSEGSSAIVWAFTGS